MKILIVSCEKYPYYYNSTREEYLENFYPEFMTDDFDEKAIDFTDEELKIIEDYNTANKKYNDMLKTKFKEIHKK